MGHEASYMHSVDYDAEDTVTVRCSCGDFCRICESAEVGEAEFHNHVSLT
jgi:hypothetical protein